MYINICISIQTLQTSICIYSAYRMDPIGIYRRITIYKYDHRMHVYLNSDDDRMKTRYIFPVRVKRPRINRMAFIII